MVIRAEAPGDAESVGTVLTAAFRGDDEAALVRALHADGSVVASLVAVVGDDVVGHVLFSRLTIQTTAAAVPGVALAPLAVLPTFERRGIGAALVREGLRRLLDLGETVVIVLGEPAYYERFGFSAERAMRLRSRYSGPAFMALELVPRALDGVAGDVVYPPAFDRFS
jgi:putative acetyltransferase